MIAKLRGRVDELDSSAAILDVGGVGYRLECSARTLSSLPERGSEAELLVETFSQDDRIRLYGFGMETERDWFLLLIGIQGIGARMALALLGMLAPEALAQAVHAGDAARLTVAPGIGTRLARRIVLELKDKTLPSADGLEDSTATAAGIEASGKSDAIAALMGLGYARAQAHDAVARALQAGEMDAENINVAELIRVSLRLLSKAS